MATTDLGSVKIRLLAQVVGSTEPPAEVGTVEVPVHAANPEALAKAVKGFAVGLAKREARD